MEAKTHDHDSPPSLTREGSVARIGLNRPGKRNRLGAEDIAALRRLIAEADSDESIRVAILEAQGPVFSAGFDLDALQKGDTGEPEHGPGAIGAAAEALAALRVPVIARLHGNIYGGAVDLALSCDFRVGTSAVEALMPAARIGLHYYRSGLARAVARLGPDATKQLFVLAEPIPAQDLLRIGYLTHLVAEEALDATVTALADRLAASGPAAVHGMKTAIDALAMSRPDDFAARYRACHADPDFARRLAALGRRKPTPGNAGRDS